MIELIVDAAIFLVGAAVGAWGYRYLLKRDPETLEEWARKARSFTD